MATNNKRKTTSSSSRGRKKPAKKQAAPIRREVGACVCLVLALLTVLCCFRIDAAILNLLGSVFRGLIGAGFYILPFSFVMSFLILILHDGRPVALRVTCTFLTAALVAVWYSWWAGALTRRRAGKSSPRSGTAASAARPGACCPAGWQAARGAHQPDRAVIVVIVGMLLSLITSLNMTVASIVTAIRNRPRAEYAEPQREHKDTAQAIVDTVATHHIEHVQRAEQRRASRMSEFDLPVDDPPLPEETPKKSAKRSAPMRPDVFVENSRRQAKPSAAPAQEPEAAEAPADAQAEPEVHTDYKSQFDALIADQPEPPAKAAEPEPEEEPAPIPNAFP